MATRRGEALMRAQSDVAAAIPKQRREDIQGLRAVAILLVLVHHARLPGFPGGFLGVDLFFVISGFLMAGLIDGRLTASSFTLRDFYARRIRRLFPAAYATLTATALAAPWLLDSVEYGAFVKQLAGAFGFVVNVVLWRQSDYFSTGAELKPLLHMWSLAVEEQYYLGLPLMLLLTPKRLRLVAMIGLTALSGAACVYLLQRAPSATFYMLPTRAWELGLGGIVAILINRRIVTAAPLTVLRILGVAAIFVVAMVFDESGHPGLPAAIVCVATGLLMIPGAQWQGRGIGHVASLIGDRSYSLYLVHWPLFAFANNVFIGPVPLPVRLGLLALCFVLAELQYRMVEQPLRHMAINRRSIALMLAVPLIVISASVLWHRAAPQAGAQDHAPNFGLSEQCVFRGPFDPTPACVSAATADTLVWGDSFAMHLVDGVREAAPAGVVQSTMSMCGPFLGLSPVDNGIAPPLWAKGCIGFNDSVAAYLRGNPQVKTVVLSSILIPYLAPEPGKKWRMLERRGEQFAELPQGPGPVLAALGRTVEMIRGLGRKVVLIAPPPSIDVDFSRCQLRHMQGKPVVASSRDCTFSTANYARRRAEVNGFLRAVQARGIVPVISLDGTLCHEGICDTRWGNTILYADHGHLSRGGVVAIAKRMDWRNLIAERTR
ncbi:acyltransferase family protein [Sphingobium sp. SCG-1]|uniref:acyltransferase family protein n=1 Tax=Sphingobium sp. SCG-1 TaxID=2072936 RepID=UPI0011AB42CD|nr:acyltransferase family protein [Sphingobium sp. SCG-1]